MIVFDDVFIPNEMIFMDGEYAFAAMLVERFTCYHRRSYVCKSGVGDVLIGAAATIADYNGVERASHIRDKLVEMTHLNETIYSTGIASSYQASQLKSGVYLNDDMIANVCKHHVTKMPYEIGRLAQDLAGGLMVTAPSQKELDHPEIGTIIRKYLQGRKEIATGGSPAHPAPDREHDARSQCGGVFDGIDARRGLAAGAAHSDCAPDATRFQEAAREDTGGYRARFCGRDIGGYFRLYGPGVRSRIVAAMHPVNPLSNPDFRKLFAAQIIALVGTGLSTVALTLLAYDLVGGNAAAVLGTALAFKMIAYVVFAPIVGGLAHRFPRKAFLIAMDVIRAGIVLAMPFVTEVWQIYALIFLLNLFSAGFKPVFAATIPDIVGDERAYTRALSMSRLAYDLENLLSPLFAGLALLVMTYTGLFVTNSVAFLVSAALIIATHVPSGERAARLGGLWDQITFGLRAYLRTPRLRALLALYMAVSAASAMVIVNTVVYVRESLGGTESDVAMAMAAAGGGSMLAALFTPWLLDRVSDRPVMLAGALIMAIGVGLMSTGPDFAGVLPIWFVIGLGWSLVQTPSGRIVNRSAAGPDRPAYFSAQFALSHACWLVFYPVAGQLGTRIGIETTALWLAGGIVIFTVCAALLWPESDDAELEHTHSRVEHEHEHSHGPHHSHEHEGWEGPEPHSHPHHHGKLRHKHPFVIDDHHAIWPG